MKQRKGEMVGGGWFVMRRGTDTGRVGCRPGFPFEHPTLESAENEATRLAKLHPGHKFCVLNQVSVAIERAEDKPETA
jgi:hypothetical protein